MTVYGQGGLKSNKVKKGISLFLFYNSNDHFTSCYLSHLYNPWAVRKCHDVPLFPEKCRIGALDHLKLVELLHGVRLLGGLVTDLQQRRVL